LKKAVNDEKLIVKNYVNGISFYDDMLPGSVEFRGFFHFLSKMSISSGGCQIRAMSWCCSEFTGLCHEE
jgi:hypothetical protein